MPEKSAPPGPKSPPEDLAETEAGLSRLERHVAAQAAALRRSPPCLALPAGVTALLSSEPDCLRDLRLLPQSRARVVKVAADLQAMVDDLADRQRVLAGRIATVRSARRAGPSACTLDVTG